MRLRFNDFFVDIGEPETNLKAHKTPEYEKKELSMKRDMTKLIRFLLYRTRF